MRDQLVAVVGGNFFVNCQTAVRFQDIPVVWFNRDEDGNILVNLQQLTTTSERRMVMLDNFWMTEGQGERDIECPPSGRIVKASCANGDRLRIEFQSHQTWEEFERRIPGIGPTSPGGLPDGMRDLDETEIEMRGVRDIVGGLGLVFPLTTVAIDMHVAGTDISFGPRATTIGGVSMTGSWVSDTPVGVQIGDPWPPVESGEASRSN
ncbi:MAG TPA: hypothetical protein VI318_04960 [Baekduia sp.]